VYTNLNNGFEIDLPNKVDLLIANDFLEHIQNPAKIILDAKKLLDTIELNGRII
jgi:2-polyprenyl-3-methyl-5-hydroxy-6-metoxy-1,4-benzoquinol methylase